MANTDKEPLGSPQLPGKEEQTPVVESLSGGGEELQGVKDSEHPLKIVVATDIEKTSSTTSSIAKYGSNSVRPSLVQLGLSSTQQTTTQPKRFSAVNINKKFLEKNSASSSSPVSQPTIRVGGPTLTRPPTQSSASHSRLVTAKLTSASPASSTSGAGWSRSSSAAPPNTTGTHSPNNGSPPLPTTSLATIPVSTGAPQLPHAGKVIQPQPRSVSVLPGLTHRDAPKPVWGNVKSTAVPPSDVRNDFPTAAEVAQVASSVRTAKLNDFREAAEAAAISKQARTEEADTFRGVHLDPNAHHWDEMEEDDDNFLDSVIEFGDGRQYRIDTNDADITTASSSPSMASRVPATSKLGEMSPLKDSAPNLPVSKEDRFADDFDRSWPRSRTSPANSRDVSLPSPAISNPVPISSDTAHDIHAQQEAARVLFNERSNRLEPYSNGQRSGPGQYVSKRGGWHDSASSPTEPRSARDLPPTPQSPSIQVLQKPGDHQSRFRRFSNTSASSSNGFSSRPLGTHNRDRDQLINRDGQPPSPRQSKDGRDRELLGDMGRRSDMGPPPLPAHAMRRSSKDGGRQLPPHLSQVPTSAPIRQGRRLSRESRFSTGELNVQSARLPSQSPSLSHTSAIHISPAVPLTPLPPLSTPEIDEARKDVMHSAATRAKQRRQQEEEEREKDKERARRKAAEIEERIKAEEAEKSAIQLEADNDARRQQEEDVITVIEEAVKTVQPLSPVDSLTTIKPVIRRPPSLKGLSHGAKHFASSPSVVGNLFTQPLSSPAVQAESWRTKAVPPPLLESQPPKNTPSFVTPVHVESLVNGSEEDLEVVDFLDMGKFVGVSDALNDVQGTGGRFAPSRPVASDFFDEDICADLSSSSNVAEPIPQDHLDNSSPARDQIDPSSDMLEHVAPLKATSADHQASGLPSGRNPRNQSFYKEAAMSALDDAMSRIKGALDGMQASEGQREAVQTIPLDSNGALQRNGQPAFASRSNTQKERWIPPALRQRNFDAEPREVFHVTRLEPPQSPKPAWNAFTVNLPSASPFPLEPISKKQLQSAIEPPNPVRMDILSFDPPVEGMDIKYLSINDVLFRKPIGGYRAKFKYRVHLPRLRAMPRASITAQATPFKAYLGAFGRSSGVDEMTTWRKPVEMKESTEGKPLDTNGESLNVLGPNTAVIPVSDASPSTKAEVPTIARPRIPKMPAGSAVAIYRDSRVDAVEEDPHTSVNFIVGSELDPWQAATPSNQLNVTVASPNPPVSTSGSIDNNRPLVDSTREIPESAPSLVPSKADSKSSDESNDRTPVTPPHHTVTWTRTSLPIPVKESPARGPDPEHLRAVWSQTSNKAGIHGVNSLEGIADDFTSLPFTLQDVKSEDGETPPPVSVPPSRMSLHDVTRAFQQVPSSSSSSNPSPSHRTPPLTAPPSRPPSYAYGLPAPPGTMRPGYPYPSTIMSPGPSLMYPPMMPASPTPGRIPMNGHSPIYGQPMWMPMPAGSAPQAHANMMRPMASPYPAHMVPYSPGPPVYGHQPPNSIQNPSQHNGAQAHRERNISMMAPVVPPAGPTLYGSPVMVHAHAVASSNHGYMMHQGRAQTRADNSQIPQTPQQPQTTYTPTFRPSW